MNILIIGNGFDLAHDLPTQYVHFLNYTKVCASYGKINNQIKKKEKEKVRGVDQSLINHFAYLISCKKERFDEISALVENNIWLKHFDRIQTGEGWSDFESEISRIVQVFEDARKTIVNEITSGKRRGRMTQGQFSVLSSFIESDSSDRGINSLYNLFHKSEFLRPAFTLSYIQKCKETLLNDLKRLTRCLEIYLDYYVVGVKIDKILPDIKELPSIDKVLSFNYTDTYARLYSLNPSLEIDYIHGKADINNTVEDNNMVLGIDEFL